MAAQYPFSYIFSDAVKIFFGKKPLVQKRRDGVKRCEGREKKLREVKAGSKAKLTADLMQFIFIWKRSSRLLFLHERKNAINKAEMAYH